MYDSHRLILRVISYGNLKRSVQPPVFMYTMMLFFLLFPTSLLMATQVAEVPSVYPVEVTVPLIQEYVGEIAISMDDAPMPGDILFSGMKRTKKIIQVLQEVNCPSIGIFALGEYVGKPHGKERLELYAAAGHMIANHTYSHYKLNNVAAEDFIQDIQKAHDILSTFSTFKPFFRFPYLAEGKDKHQRAEVIQYLHSINYKEGYTTVNNHDYLINKLLVHAVKAGKEVDYEGLKKIYIDILWDCIKSIEQFTHQVVGRKVKHVLLLHENDLAALFLGDLITHIRAQGWKIIPIEEAYEDPIAHIPVHNNRSLIGRLGAIAEEQALNIKGAAFPETVTPEYIPKILKERKIFTDKTAASLFILDAFALIYRAHFAFLKNPRITSKGLNTSAVLGFTNTLVEIITKEKPTHLAVAFDTAAPTHRHITFPAYKEHREAQPEDITIAIPYIKRILAAFRIPILSLEGYEADDLIGTVAQQAAREGFHVYMMTPDKDFAQLVDDHIYLYRPAFMGNEATILDKKAVLEKWGIAQMDQMRDLLALQGDAVDNIPGIPGIGEKTAQKLIAQFGSLENLIQNTHELKGKLRENVEKYAQQGVLSKELATIHTHAPVVFQAAESAYKGPDQAVLKQLFQELEFTTLAKRLLLSEVSSGHQGTGASTNTLFQVAEEARTAPVDRQPTILHNLYTTPHQYHVVDTPALRKGLLEHLKCQPTFCFDVETTSLDPYEAQLVGISFAYYPGEAYYVPIPENQAEAQQVVEEFRPLFESTSQCKVGQNLKYDSLVLRCYGIEVALPVFDTMIAHHLVAPELSHGMNAMAAHYLHYAPVPIEALIGEKKAEQKSMRTVDLEVIKEYACEDADITLQLKSFLEKEVEEEKLHELLYEVELPLLQVLTAMEYQGVALDTGILKNISSMLAEELILLEEVIYQLAGLPFNINSPKQLGEVLFEHLKLTGDAKKTKSGQYATSELVLADLAHLHPIVDKLLSYRELQKLKSTYVDALPNLLSDKDGKIHTSYNQAVVATGRLSSVKPNLQNIPIRTQKSKAIRAAFVPSQPHHVLLSADYSQIELRIMAYFSQDKTMIEAFKAGKDVHAITASKLFKVSVEEVTEEMRRQAKTANFGIIYGISAFGLAQRLNLSRTEAGQIIEAYFQEFPAVKAYMDQVINQGREQGYVQTLLGRKRYLRNIHSRNASLRGFDERNAINAPIQGTAAEMIKRAMVHIYQWLQREKLQSKLILQVHDELVLEVPLHEVDLVKDQVAHYMKNALPLAEVPLEVQIGIGKNWAEAH
eukprot:gene108-144_t